MGLGVEHIQSEKGHYACFVCVVCNSLADVDAVVTTKCSHPFCRACITSSSSTAPCPACSLEGDVKPLVMAQPLAHSCMTLIRVSCPNCSVWEGEYGKLNEHKQTCPGVHNGKDVGRPRRGRSRAVSMDPSRQRVSSMTPSVDTSNNASTSLRTEKRGVSDGSSSIMQDSFLVDLSTNSFSAKDGSNGDKKRISSNSATLSEANVLKEKGNAKFNKGEFGEARSYYDQAISLVNDIKLDSGDDQQTVATLYCNRGAAHAKAKNVDAALLDYDESIRISPEYAKAYARKFKILAAQGKLLEGKSCLEVATQRIPGDKNMMEDLRKTRQIVDGMQLVIKLLQMRNYTEAKTAGDSLLKLTDNTESVLLSAEADASVGLIESGLGKCDFVLKANAASLVGLRAKGYIALLGNDIDSASSTLKEALKHDPNNPETKEFYRLCRKVQTDIMDGRACASKAEGSRTVLRKAVDHFSALIDEEDLPPLTPLLCMLRIERGEVGLQLMHYPAALTDARLALECDPTNARALIVKSEALIATGRATEARDELQVARRTHGRGSEKIRDAFIRADFECKILEADKELRAMVAPTNQKKERASEGAIDTKRPRGRPGADSGQTPDGGRKPVSRRNSTTGTPQEKDVVKPLNRRRSVGPNNGERRSESVDRNSPRTEGRSESMDRAALSRKNSKEPRGNGENGRTPRKKKPTMSESEARRRVSMI